jgi:hypothetical protein
MRLSPRARDDGRNDGLRSLLVHRLRDGLKAVVRLPNKVNIATADSGHYNVHCEPCGEWFVLREWGEEVQHAKCGRVYALEVAVFSLIEEPEESEG